MTPEEVLGLLQQQILGDLTLTANEVIESAGASRVTTEALWTGLGFGSVTEGAKAFSPADADVLRSLVLLEESGLVDESIIVPLTRVLGQALSRVASAQVEAFSEGITDLLVDLEGEEIAEVIDQITELLVPGMEAFISYTWRRHLVAALRRRIIATGPNSTVGFADLADFTRETRDISEEDLTHLIDRFQRIAYDQITEFNGRIIKVVGDGVMFETPDPVPAGLIAVGLVNACEAEDKMLAVSVGLASGEVVNMEGDLWGETVNRASRLADFAKPGTVVADYETGHILGESGQVLVREMKARRLKGLGPVECWSIRPLRFD